MISNTNDGTTNPPRLRIDINGANIFALPATSSLHGDDRSILQQVKAAGFEGVQTGAKAALCRELGLRVTYSARIDSPQDAEMRVAESKQINADCCTVHIGTGLEDDDATSRLVEAALRASEKHHLPIYLETHRATITQDIWRTVRLTQKFPELRFNGDFSHWYTGQEMVYGDIEAKWNFIQPVFDRVRFIHGRIGNPGCMQVDIGDGAGNGADAGAGAGRPYVQHFKEMWTRSFVGFLKSASPGDYICFTPELLGPGIYYARTFPNAAGEPVEESDRWQQARLYATIARDCFA
jgi:hypothetical protein